MLTLPVSGAEGGHEEGWGIWDPIGRWFNLLFLAGLLFFLLRGRLKKYFVDRSAGIREEIRKANEDYEKALADLNEAEERIRNLDDELARMRRQAAEEAEAERLRVLEQAARDAERVVESARKEIEGLTRNARNELREYAAELAVGMAESEIRTRMTPDDQKRAAERFLVELSSRDKE
jgi:F-type H+-transporting ATPase subunit b